MLFSVNYSERIFVFAQEGCFCFSLFANESRVFDDIDPVRAIHD